MRAPVLVVLAAVTAAGCSASNPADSAIQVSVSHCGKGWTHPHPGRQTLQIRNTGDVAAEAYLVETGTGQIYGELENLSPGTTRAMPVNLGGGTFALRCAPDDADPITGPAARIIGPARAGIGVPP